MARPYVRFAHGSRSGLLGRGFAGGRVSSTVATVATLQPALPGARGQRLHRLIHGGVIAGLELTHWRRLGIDPPPRSELVIGYEV